MKTYSFSMREDGDTGNTVSMSITTECDSWSSFDGPVYLFEKFLRACGYVFNSDTVVALVDTSTGEVKNY